MIDAFPVDTGQPGRLSLVLRPRGGDWLADELQGLRRKGYGTLVSLLLPAEEQELELADEERLAGEAELVFLRFPVADRSTPSFEIAVPQVAALASRIRQGEHVAVHCRQGIGRSGLTVAAILVALGFPPTEAWDKVERARGRPVPDTPEQRQWLTLFEENLNATRT